MRYSTNELGHIIHHICPTILSITIPKMISKITDGDGSTYYAALSAKMLHDMQTTAPRRVPSVAEASKSDETICTDHMILANWNASTGWEAPQLKPYGDLSLAPTASCLHYATQCFEGLKAFRGYDGRLRLFRPDRNVARFLMSAERLALPSFDPHEVKELIMALLARDAPRWLPRDRPGEFLYIRPSIVGTQQQLGLQRSRSATLFVVATFMARLNGPVGGLRLVTSSPGATRSWPGGFGYAKIGANYGPTVKEHEAATTRGFSQVLWLYGKEEECTEAGGSNFFIVWRRAKDGKKELITAPLNDGIILDGITRRSCLELAAKRCQGEVEVSERKLTIGEVIQASEDGRLLEAFVCGTAWFVGAVSLIEHRGQQLNIPAGEDGQGGDLTQRIRQWLVDIMYGAEEHEWAEVVPEEESK
ncbi:branched-chain amino acid aminotransferase [Paramyrothecium foliicola]|nr:branched-chain amino acid aminotransferase [Paramyrothecium foliicola]